MPRLLRILLNAATAVSLALFAGVTVAGAWGYVATATIALRSDSREDLIVGTSDGMLYANHIFDLESRGQAEDVDVYFAGFTRVCISAGTRQYRGNGVSIWTLLIMTGPLPAFRVLRRWRGRRNLEPGACPACGYDLRATPEQCPECGTMATVTNEHANKQLTGGLPKAEGNDA